MAKTRVKIHKVQNIQKGVAIDLSVKCHRETLDSLSVLFYLHK